MTSKDKTHTTAALPAAALISRYRRTSSHHRTFQEMLLVRQSDTLRVLASDEDSETTSPLALAGLLAHLESLGQPGEGLFLMQDPDRSPTPSDWQLHELMDGLKVGGELTPDQLEALISLASSDLLTPLP